MDVKEKESRSVHDEERNRDRIGPRRGIVFMLILLLLALRLLAPTSLGDWLGKKLNQDGSHSRSASKPNFILIMTDDQDLRMDSINYQPKVREHFIEEGTTYSNHFCTVALCCPSRVSFLTGKAAHNTNITDVGPPYGGYPKFVKDGWNDKYLPVWLQGAGYNTYYTGKLMNGHSTRSYNQPFPKAWNGTNFLLDPGTYTYYNSITQKNSDPPRHNPGIYSTDIVAGSAVELLDESSVGQRPFFLGVAPIAPHSETVLGDEVAFYAPVPAERHKDSFPDLQVPRTPNFNPNISSGGGYIKGLEKVNDTVVQYNDEFYRARIQSLLAVDDLIESIMNWMNAHPDILQNTYLIYTTDNGYHIGQHRLPPGKTCNIEEDIHIPFFIRGPDIEKGKTVSYATSHTDLVPTIFELAGITLHDDFDGEPIPLTAEMEQSMERSSEHINVEFWGTGLFEGIYSPEGEDLAPNPGLINVSGPNNTHKTVRVISEEYDISYSVWCTNEHELYDMKNDPYQMNNLYNSPEEQKMFGHHIRRLVPRIDALLLTLKACKGKTCTRPWQTLHPDSRVGNLMDAMDAEYDDFYMLQQKKVEFTGCSDGYHPWLEGPMEPLPHKGKNGKIKRAARWQDWT